MDQQDAVVACLHRLEADNRWMKRIGATALGILALGLLAAMAGKQDPESVAVQRVLRTERIELTNRRGEVVALLQGVAAVDPSSDELPVTAYHGNGRRAWEGKLVNGRRQGQWISWAENGTITSIDQYEEGRRVGTWRTYWHSTGYIVSEGAYEADLKEGMWRTWYGSRTERVNRSVGAFLRGERHGLTVFWHENGLKSSEGAYQNGKRAGHWTAWYEDGRMYSEGDFEDGKETEYWAYWHSNGQMSSEGEFKDGEKTDRWTAWHRNGQRNSEGKFEDGMKSGNWTYWYDNGQEQSDGRYKDGKRIGQWQFWRTNGSVDRNDTGVYENGRKIR